jgi:hypothetical protein
LIFQVVLSNAVSHGGDRETALGRNWRAEDGSVKTPSRGTLAVAAIVIAAVAGCSDATPREVRHEMAARATGAGSQTVLDRRWGYRVTLPSGWHRATRSLTPNVTDPVEILAVATFPLPSGESLCGTSGALARVRPRGALVTLQERGIGAYGGPDFPPRPDRFGSDPRLPGRSEWPYCAAIRPGGRRSTQIRPVPMLDYYFGFGDAGRAFHALVAVGKSAPDRVREQAFQILDSLRFDPTVKPTWHTSG